MCTDIDRIAELAKEDPTRQFYSIAHLITVEKSYEAFRSLRKNASAGIDGVTYVEYEIKAEKTSATCIGAARGRQVSGTTAAPSLYSQGERETEAHLDSQP
jgi:hypothetical protein